MKKIIFLIFILFLNFKILLGEDFTIINGQIIANKGNYIKLFDKKINKEIIIIGKFPDLKCKEYVKIFIDDNGKIIKIKKVNLKGIRKRIRKIGKFKCKCRCNKRLNQNFHNSPEK